MPGDPIGAVVVGGSAASNPTAQLSLAGSNNGSNLHVARNLFTYEDRVSFTKGRHQFTLRRWFQRLQSNENSGAQPVRPGDLHQPADFPAGHRRQLCSTIPRRRRWAGARWFGAWYVEDAIRVDAAADAVARLPRRIHHRLERSARPRVHLHLHRTASSRRSRTIGNSAFTVNNAKFLPQPRVGLAWSPFGNTQPTVIRAGFGMYNDLQDALGYRTDQNAPFNPTYSLPNLPVSHASVSPTAPVPATAKLVPGGVQPDLQTPTLISWSFRIEQELTPIRR